MFRGHYVIMIKVKGDRRMELTLVQEGGQLVKKITGFLLLIMLIPCMAFAELTVHFLDVGQGDSAIIICDGEAMIIDGGLRGQSSKIYSFLQKNYRDAQLTNRNITINGEDNRRKIIFMYMIATHPDRDHIGGLPAVFQLFKVPYIYSPVKEYDSDRFNILLNSANEQKTKIKVPFDCDSIDLGGATVTFYNAESEKKSFIRKFADRILRRDEPEENPENNDMSLVVKIVYKEVTFLFTGDIEAEAEKRLLASGINLKADVLKVAHHGSKGSSTIDFLEKVQPEYAVISAGKNQKYKHPSAETLMALQDINMDIKLFRTDLHGDITFTTDGKSIEIKTDKNSTKDELFKAPQ